MIEKYVKNQIWWVLVLHSMRALSTSPSSLSCPSPASRECLFPLVERARTRSVNFATCAGLTGRMKMKLIFWCNYTINYKKIFHASASDEFTLYIKRIPPQVQWLHQNQATIRNTIRALVGPLFHKIRFWGMHTNMCSGTRILSTFNCESVFPNSYLWAFLEHRFYGIGRGETFCPGSLSYL